MLSAAQARFVRRAVQVRRQLCNKSLAVKYGVSENTIAKYGRGLRMGRQ
jgi:hypothetical protein